MNASWRRYARFWGPRVDADVDDELSFHAAMLARDFEARGLTPNDARAAALARLGDVPSVRDECLTIGHRRQRRMTRAQTIDAFVQDCRYALRTFDRQKGWTAIALLTLALGIGASTAMFSVLNSLVLHPLSYVGSDRVMLLWMIDPKGGMMVSPSAAIGQVWKNAHSFDAFEPYGVRSLTMTGRGDPLALESGMINSSFLTLAGARPIIGRAFAEREHEPAGARVVMIAERLWRSRFGGTSAVLGQHVTLDGRIYDIIGVLPSSLRVPGLTAGHIDAWTPMGADTAASGIGLMVARLRPGVAQADAARELDSLTARGGVTAGPAGFRARLMKPGDFLSFKDSLYLLSLAVGVLLLVACANVVHLMLTRGAMREREFAIRVSLGANRLRLTRQLLTESLILAAAGCLGGILIGYLGVRGLLMLRPESLEDLTRTQLDARSLIAAIALSVLTGITFGLTFALHALRRTSSDTLRATALAGTANRETHRVRAVLVVTEMALSAMLLVGAMLLVRSVRNLQHVDVHISSKDLYSLQLEMPESRYPTMASRTALMKEIGDRIARLAVVDRAALAQGMPPDVGYMTRPIETEDGRHLPDGMFVASNTVSPKYFDVLGLPVVRGSTFSDLSSGTRQMIINEGLAQKLWPGGDAVGKRVRFAAVGGRKPEQWSTVAGVVGNMPAHGLSSDPAAPMFYLSLAQNPGYVSEPVVLVVRSRTGVDPTAALRRAVMSLETHAAPPSVQSVSAAYSESISRQRFTMNLLAVFAILAVVLSAIGLYGVISYVVTQRAREIGIRIALGAMPAQVARAIAARGLLLSTVGLVVGLVGAVWATKVIKSTLFGVTETDALSYVATGIALLAVSIVASVIPMRRAMRVDPVIAMRND